jgi:hypothetical protein
VEHGDKLSRVSLHSIIPTTPSSDIKPWEGSHGKFYMGEATERETFMLILGGLHERQAV